MTGLTPPSTGSETLNEYLTQLQRVVDVLDLRKIPEEGWSLTDLKADVSEVISDKRVVIDVANEAARKLAEVKAHASELDGYDQSLEEARAFKAAAESLIDWYDQNEVAVQALQEMVSKEGGASQLVTAFDAIRIETNASATAARASATEAKGYANVVRAAEFRPESYGAVGDGVTNDAPAINQALVAATQAGGGSVPLTGKYAVSSPVGAGIGAIANVRMYGAGDAFAKLVATANTPVIGGKWHQSTIDNVFVDAAGKGSPCVSAHFDKMTFASNFLVGWTDYGMFLNSTGDEFGLLNRIDGNHIVQGTGIGIWTTYRFIDSWITGNNIGSTGPNLSLEAGPLRINDNHLNGTPEINIDLRGNQRITIIGNICEGARAEAIRYNMPPWLTADEPQIQIVGNALSNGGKAAPGTKPAIGIYGLSTTKRVKGFNIVGNIISCQDEGSGWNYAVQATNAAEVVATGNQWELGHTATSAVNGDVESSGNTSWNKISASDINATAAATADTVVLRNSAGRILAANPSGATDVVNKGTMDAALALKAATTYVDTKVGERTLPTTVSTMISQAISGLVGSAPQALDTVYELAAYLTDSSVASGLVQQLAAKAPLSHEHTPADVNASFSAAANTIPVRDSSGRLAATMPTAPGQVAIKDYVDQRPALFSGVGAPPASVAGAVVGDFWLNTTTMELSKITGV